jgi:hypothetical protein
MALDSHMRSRLDDWAARWNLCDDWCKLWAIQTMVPGVLTKSQDWNGTIPGERSPYRCDR